MEDTIVEIEAEALEEAREQVKAQIPKGLSLISEQVISDGEPKTVRAVSDTTVSAFAKAQGDIPSGATILEKKETISPAQKVVMIEAFDEQTARTQVENQIGETEVIKALKLARTGKQGFLGIGKKPNQYEAQVFQKAVAEITYKTKAKISALIGELPTIKKEYSYARDRLLSHVSTLSCRPMDVLDDVIRVIDEYSSGEERKISAWDFVELTQYLSNTRSRGLSGVIAANKEVRMMKPIFAGLKKLVLIRDCGVDRKAIPDDVDAILQIKGPSEVDWVIRYLTENGLA